MISGGQYLFAAVRPGFFSSFDVFHLYSFIDFIVLHVVKVIVAVNLILFEKTVAYQ